MNPRFATAALAAALLAPSAGPEATMKMERERLVNLEGPATAGFLKLKADFQHNFKDYTLLPVADLTLAFGVWPNVQVEAETLLHNQRMTSFGHESVFQFNVVEYTLKWAPLDQSREDWFSLAVGGTVGRSDVKFRFRPAAGSGLGSSRLRYHLNTRSVYAVAHYNLARFAPTLGIRHVAFEQSFDGRLRSVTTPGIGARAKLVESEKARVHLIGDYQFATFESRFSAPAWGAGVQFMVRSPHVYTLFVGNTHGDTSAESVFGSRSLDPAKDREPEKFYSFRWSYRF